MSCKRGTYSTFKNYWGYQKEINKEITRENYFVSYAIRGPSIAYPMLGEPSVCKQQV
jgi:hypothetical protein